MTMLSPDVSVEYCEVVVVGAGPAGLLLAGELARAGVRVTVLDRLAEPGAKGQRGYRSSGAAPTSPWRASQTWAPRRSG